MPSTYNRALVASILGQIEEAIDTIRTRTRDIQSPEDFTATPEGREKLDGVCMLFMAIGEALKRVDRMTDGALLARHPEVDWKGAMGFRDIIAHQYFDIDPENRSTGSSRTTSPCLQPQSKTCSHTSSVRHSERRHYPRAGCQQASRAKNIREFCGRPMSAPNSDVRASPIDPQPARRRSRGSPVRPLTSSNGQPPPGDVLLRQPLPRRSRLGAESGDEPGRRHPCLDTDDHTPRGLAGSCSRSVGVTCLTSSTSIGAAGRSGSDISR